MAEFYSHSGSIYLVFPIFVISGLGSSGLELSLLRDSQTVQAYFGPIAKLPSPTSWASRTAASCALSKKQSEEIMELKRQLAHTNQDLHMTKVIFLLSSQNGPNLLSLKVAQNILKIGLKWL